MIRVGLSGTNWTRKSTTIQKVVEALNPQPIEVIILSDLVSQCPYPMGPNQTLDGSRWMIDRVSKILDSSRSSDAPQLFDRTPLDIFAFTLHAAKNQGPDRDIDVEALFDAIRGLGCRFDRIFLCRPSNEWPAPETPRQDDLEFAKIIDDYLVRAVKHFPSNVVELPWQTAERIVRIVESVAGEGSTREFTV